MFNRYDNDVSTCTTCFLPLHMINYAFVLLLQKELETHHQTRIRLQKKTDIFMLNHGTYRKICFFKYFSVFLYVHTKSSSVSSLPVSFHLDSYHTERELDRGMGCSQSTSVPANGSGAELEDQVFLPNSSSGENTQPTPTPVTNKDSVESSSGDEDQDKLYSDLGRQQVSDADLIQVQRSEKPDVTPVLEDRWLRSHFSGTKAAATTRISSNNIAQRFEEDSLKNAQIKTPEFQNNAINLTDTVKKHQCASVAVDGKIHSGDITYGNVRNNLHLICSTYIHISLIRAAFSFSGSTSVKHFAF